MDSSFNSRRDSGSSEQKQVEKYIKFFAVKSLQCVVQSRLGVRNKTNCNPSAKGRDWFNISLPEGEVNVHLQTKIRDLFGKSIPGLSKPICVDIVLKTTEGSYTVLETWQITTTKLAEGRKKNHFSIYNRLGILLKSVITSSRLLPSFYLSRKNESDFHLYGRVHSELYQLHHFELHNTINIGSVVTTSGIVNVKVLYRNKIWLSGSIHPHTYNIENIDSLFALATEKVKGEMFFQSEDFEREIAQAASETGQFSPTTFSPTPKKETLSSPNRESIADDTNSIKQSILSEPPTSFDNSMSVAAFVQPSNNTTDLANLDLPMLSAVPPFMSLFEEDTTSDKTIEQKSVDKTCVSSKVSDTDNDSEKSSSIPRTAEAVGFEDDFVVVELRPAFCADDESVGTLYRQCQTPAVLDMFASLEREDEEGDAIDLDTQLERYQKELKEFQDFFKVLGH